MGVPKFYRWISERYPCLSETVKEFQIPEFDNLYLDMNGIVHVCSHPEDDNPHFRITEERIFQDIFHYIEFIFRMIKPKKVFFMAIDGVAPRAKMNQQRGRRFRSAREAEELIKRAQLAGEVLPTEKRFDSNCITPGTPFMVRLQEALKYFVVQKVSNDPLWQGPRIYLSGHETPGEGEHKVMDFIRYEKSGPDYDANTRHCLYGLDADLIMLGLTSHEPHFALLREEVRFGGRKEKNKRPATPEETTFHLLQLSLLREYLDYEFAELKNKLPFPYDLENIIDDWILMGFLVGNDFIPHLPYLHIKNDALPMLWKTYIEVLPTLDGYLNEGGHLNLKRFETYITTLAKFDIDSFSDQYTDIKWMESKVGNKHINEAAGKAAAEKQLTQTQKKQSDLSPFAAFGVHEESESSGEISSSDPSPDKDDDDEDDDNFDTFHAEFRQHKRNYYMDKLEYENVTADVLENQAKGYVLAIQWILLYYFEGVPSWSWYYPHHYAPFISDVKDFSDMKIEFDIGKPFLPFQQLMAVLPAASKDLLPRPLQTLMINDSSPVIDYYPVDFKTDLNGKQQDWEAVVLIPFIDEKRLLDAMSAQYRYLSAEEASRNTHGPCLLSVYNSTTQGVYRSPLPGVFPDIGANHTHVSEIPIDEFVVDANKLRKGLMEGVRLDVYFPGFPTLYHITHTARLNSEGVKVFQMNSRGQNMILDIVPSPHTEIEMVVENLLGKTTFVGWPHLFEAKIVAVSDGAVKHELVEDSSSKSKKSKSPKLEKKVSDLSNDDAQIFYRTVDNIKERYRDRQGVNIGITPFLVYGCPMTGRKYAYGSQGRITLEKQFSVQPVPFAFQATVQNIAVHDPTFCEYMSMEDLFPAQSAVFMLGSPHYGCQGEVLEVDSNEGRVRVNFTVQIQPDINSVLQQCKGSINYVPGYVAAQRIGVHTHFLSRITGTIYLQRGSPDNPSNGKANIGLNLKFSKRGMEVPGYTKKTEDGWLYSKKSLEVIGQYLDKFPELCEYLSNENSSSSDNYEAYDIFGEDCGKKLKEIEEFIKSLPCSKVSPVNSGSETVDENIVLAIEEEASKIHALNKEKERCVKMQVKPHLLYRPVLGLGPIMPDPHATFELYDRIVISKQGYAVPFGLRGTVVGIHPAEKEMDVLYDVVFDEEFIGGIEVRCSKNRGYRVPCFTMINLTYGEMKEKGTLHLRGQKVEKSHHRRSNRKDEKPKYGILYPQGSKQDDRQFNSGRGYSNQRNNQQGASSNSYNTQPFPNAWASSSQGSNRQKSHDNSHSGKVFNNEKYPEFSGEGKINPQFVTPKVSPSQNPMRKTYSDYAGQSRGRGHVLQQQWPNKTTSKNSEFSDMWSQLQAKSPTKQSSSSPPPSKAYSDGQAPSLTDAIKALPKITPPSISPNAATLLTSSNNTQNRSTPSPNRPSDLSLNNSNSTKIDLNQLFGSAGNQKVMAQDEFSSNLESLSISQNDKAEDISKNVSSEALKQMLHVNNTEEKPSDSPQQTGNTKSYGTQLSVQELFKVAKEKSPPEQREDPRQHNHQKQNNILLETPHVSIKPIEELNMICISRFKQEPRYDIENVNPNGYVVYVTIPNMGRFNGAVCGSKNEAKASAASIALLRLGGARTAFTRFPGQPDNRAANRQLFSPNSAFSPVMRVQSMGNPGAFRLPFNMQGFPGQPVPQSHQQAFGVRQNVNQWVANFNQRQPANQYNRFPNGFPPGYNQHFAQPNQHSGFHQQQQQQRPNYTQQQHGAYNQMVNQHSSHYQQQKSHNAHQDLFDAENKNNNDISKHSEQSSKSNPFIPLQVTKKQKTPSKVNHHTSDTSDTASLNDSKSSIEIKSVCNSATIAASPRTPKSESKPKNSPPKSGQKKRRTRIAANLNFGPS